MMKWTEKLYTDSKATGGALTKVSQYQREGGEEIDKESVRKRGRAQCMPGDLQV